MELQPIGQVSKQYGISIQTLRYYEQIGLIQSTRNDDNAYRFYDEAAIKQLHSVILLRKLRISMKQIKEILDNQNTAATVEILERNISELDEEITSLSTVKSILTRFAEELRTKTDTVLKLDLLNDTAMLSIADPISFSKNYIKNIKEKVSMDELNKANETLNRLKDSDVRIIYLSPMTVAAAGHCSVCEGIDFIHMAEKFVRETGLLKIKPDARGMMKADNISKDESEEDEHSAAITATEAEMWVSIPDDMEVPAPLTKKTFEGGLYAAQLFRNGFEDKRFLAEWMSKTDGKYELDDERPSFLETLNYCNFYRVQPNYEEGTEMNSIQRFDVLFPIKKITV